MMKWKKVMSVYKYLNKVMFEWKSSYYTDNSGCWICDPTSHPHKQWINIGLQSNVWIYGPNTIAMLCEDWIDEAMNLLGDETDAIGMDTILYKECMKDCQINNINQYRMVLDKFIEDVEHKIYCYLWITMYNNGKPKDIAISIASKFCKDFEKSFE